jgi:hypothetical protein
MPPPASEVMTDDGHAAMPHRVHQPERIAREVEQPKRREIAVVVGVPPVGAA